MPKWKAFLAMLASLKREVYAWQLRSAIKWEDRYMDQYQMQLDDIKAGMAESQRRRDAMVRRARSL